jgi:flagellar protein FlaI
MTSGSGILETGEEYVISKGKTHPLYRIRNIRSQNAEGKTGYGRLQPLVNDDNLEEIMVLGTGYPVYVYHRKFGMCETNLTFVEASELEEIIQRIAAECGRKVDSAHPLLEARMPDGSRVNATLPQVTLQGHTLTIRKFLAEPLTIVDLIKSGTLTVEAAAFLWLAVDGMGIKSSNILVAGGGGCGKTTTLNCLGMFIPPRERVITIEDTIELQLPVKHKISLEARPPGLNGGEITMDMLLKNALRMRPDRIIMGELRGEEAKTFFAAINTGHDGAMSTFHANSARESIQRLTNPPMNVHPIMIPSLNLIVMQSMFTSGGKTIRRITEIAEVGGIEGEKILLNNIYEYDPRRDVLVPTGTPSKMKHEIAKKSGVTIESIKLEMEKRELLLDFLVEHGINRQIEVYDWIENYYSDQKTVFDRINQGEVYTWIEEYESDQNSTSGETQKG